jgi:hypothetical protein
MLRLEQHGYLVPFPRVPDSIREKYFIGNLSLRPFGLFENDLEVNFHQKLRPHLVTQVLECCTRDKSGKTPDQAFFWELAVGKRIECLLTIATLRDSSDLSVRLRCLSEACGQQMGVEISIEELATLQHRADDTFIIRVGDESLPIRKPTGVDQLEWLKGSYPDEDATAKAMIRTLVLDNEKASCGKLSRTTSNQEGLIPDEWVQPINSAMEEFDPLVNFSLSVYCPYCEKESQYEIDLEELSLRKLHKAQLQLLDVVHRLAVHYHWSEQQIFSIPPWRRSHYLALIEREERQ